MATKVMKVLEYLSYKGRLEKKKRQNFKEADLIRMSFSITALLGPWEIH